MDKSNSQPLARKRPHSLQSQISREPLLLSAFLHRFPAMRAALAAVVVVCAAVASGFDTSAFVPEGDWRVERELSSSHTVCLKVQTRSA